MQIVEVHDRQQIVEAIFGGGQRGLPYLPLVELAVRLGRPAEEVVREAKKRGVNPGYPLGRDYAGMEDVLLVAVTEKRSPADIERLAEVLGEVLA